MKRAAVIIVLAFAIGLAMSSCNREVCPAMADTADNTVEVPQA